METEQIIPELVRIIRSEYGSDVLDWSRRDTRSIQCKKVLIKLSYDLTGYSYRAIGRQIGTSHVNIRHHLELFDADMVFLKGLIQVYYDVKFRIEKVK